MSPAARRLTLVLLTTIYGMGFVDRIVIALVAQQIKVEFSVTDLEIGLLSGTAFALVNTVAGVPIARIAERRARKWVACLSLLCVSLFTLSASFAGSFVQLVFFRLGMAAGSAGTEAPPHSMISDMYPPAKRASAMSLFLLGVPAAALIGSAVGGGIAEARGWRAAFVTMGALGVAISAITFWLAREPERGAQEAVRSDEVPGISVVLGTIWRSPMLRQIFIGIAVISVGGFAINTFLPAFFARNYHLGAGETGLLYGLISSIASATGTITGGFAAEWLARRDPRLMLAVPGIAPVVGVPVFIIGLMQSDLRLAFPLMLLGSIVFYMAQGPAIAALHGALDSRSRATGSALFLMTIYIVGQGLGPPVAGYASDVFSAWAYGAGSFADACAGAAGQTFGSRCGDAAASGVRYAIAALAMFYVWGGLHLLRGGFSGSRGRPEAGAHS